MHALATPEQLGSFLQQPIAVDDPTALLMLDIASGMVRDYLQTDLDHTVDDVHVLDPEEGAFVTLGESPILEISKLEIYDGTTWTVVPKTEYVASPRLGIVSAVKTSMITFPKRPETWRVTFTHGFETIPPTIVGVVLGIAARFFTAPDGITSESLGGYSVSYAGPGEGFTKMEQTALARYKNPRIS